MAEKKSFVYHVKKAERDGCKERGKKTLVLLSYVLSTRK